jgi:hypothetical protein
MSNARSDLLLYIGVALATLIGLFVLHVWYGSFLDVRFNASLSDQPPSEALVAAREEDQKALSSGKVPLAQAMSVIGRQGRPASVKPAPSQDLSAVSGWIHQRGFKPQTAFPVRTAAKPVVAAAAAPAEAAPAPTPTTEPAPAPAPTGPAAKPPVRQLKLKTEMVRPARPQGAP